MLVDSESLSGKDENPKGSTGWDNASKVQVQKVYSQPLSNSGKVASAAFFVALENEIIYNSTLT